MITSAGWQLFVAWTPMVTGIFMIAFSLLMKTQNIPSSILFKIIPFFLGAASCLVGLDLLGLF